MMMARGKRQVLVYLPVRIHAQLRLDAARAEVSMSEIVEHALAHFTRVPRRSVSRPPGLR